MRFIVMLGISLACGKGKDASPVTAGSGSDTAEPVELANGLAVKSETAGFSGSYDKVFARFTNGDDPNTIVWVRGCPALTCDPAFEIERVAHVCPKAYLATAKFPGDHAGRFQVKLELAGPAESASTTTMDVSLELSKLDNDGVVGKVTRHDAVSSAKGTFTATMCPRT